MARAVQPKVKLGSKPPRKLLPLLGSITALSLATNAFLWWGDRHQTRRVRKTDAAWIPSVTGGDAAETEHSIHNRKGHVIYKHHINPTATSYDKILLESSKKRHRSSELSDTDYVLREERTKSVYTVGGKNDNRQRTIFFRPHPARGGSSRRHRSTEASVSPPWILSLPAKSTKSKTASRMIRLDGAISERGDDTKLEQDWFVRSEKRTEIGNATEDELAWKSQTVVWENDTECVLMSEWQNTFHPTCNSLHEMDVSSLLHSSAFSLVSSKGHWRNAWKVNITRVDPNGSQHADSSRSSNGLERIKKHDATEHKFAVIKSLKYIHELSEEVYELSRVDAVSLDVLTRSRFTINIYGFCGSSSIQEFAGGDLKELLPALDAVDKLRMAVLVAEGVAEIHAVDFANTLGEEIAIVKNDPFTENIPSHIEKPALIHNDINMDNVLLGHRDGVEIPILNDFNIAVFQKKNVRTGEPCRFHGRFANPQWMSPEQQERSEDELSTGFLTEKIDIYALGNILYKIVVGSSPWKYDYKGAKRITSDMKAKIARAKLRGAKPKLPLEVRNSTDPRIKAILTAMDRCYRNNPQLRPSARELASYLKSQLNAVETLNL